MEMEEKSFDTPLGQAEDRHGDVPPPPKPAAKAAAAEKPMRRVGSVTLGVALIAVGVFFLLYYFVPRFDWLLALKIVPALMLMLLGGEVLVCAARPGRWKYDFLAVFACLLLMGASFCLTLLPLVWNEISPARSTSLDRLTDAYETGLYEDLKQETPEVRLRGLYCWLDLDFGAQTPETMEELKALGSAVRLTAGVELYGPYASVEDFARDCRRVMDVVAGQEVQPEYVTLEYEGPEGEQCALRLSSRIQMDWTAEQMAQQTDAYGGIFDDPEEWEEDGVARTTVLAETLS